MSQNKASLAPIVNPQPNIKLVNNPQPLTVSVNPNYSTWFQIQCYANESNGTPLVLNIDQDSHAPNSPIIVYPQQGTTNNELWQFAPDGHIVSRIDSNIVLDVNGSNQLISNNWNSNNSQIWTRNGNLITNKATNLNITVQTSSSTPNSSDTVVASSSTGSTSQWYSVPTLPLTKILAQQPEPFPAYTGDQLTAYNQISETIALVPSIRDQYTNLSAPLASFQINLSNMSCPSNVTEADFTLVKNQINNELTCAQAIINLFSNYYVFHTALFADNSARLNALAIACGLEIGSSQSVNGIMTSLFSGILYTLLCAVPVASGINPFGIAANIIQTGVNIAVSASNSHTSISPNGFQVELCKLWDYLSSNFEALLTSIGNVENALLQDWGMMQSSYKLITDKTDPNSLAWSPTNTGEIIQAAVPGYQIGILQMLMPSKYQIYTWNDGAPPSIPSYCQWTESTGAKLLFFIADLSNPGEYPTSNLMDTYIWNNGVGQNEFYQSKFGWTFPSSVLNYSDSDIFKKCTLTISNNTSVPLQSVITCGKSTYNSTIWTYQSMIGPELSSNYDVTIKDMNGNNVATFNVYLQTHTLEGSGCEIANVWTADGYIPSSPLTNQASYKHNYCAACNFSISLNSN